MPHMPGGISMSQVELHQRRSDKTDIDAAQALIDAVRRNDVIAVQRITRRPDIARIAVALADRIVLPPLRPCGTRAAAERHLSNGEELDAACLAARRRYYRDIKRGQRPGRPPASSTASSPTTSSPAVDPIVVERLIDGQPPLHVTRAERAAAVRLLDHRGHT